MNDLIEELADEYLHETEEHIIANAKKFKHKNKCKACGLKYISNEKKNIKKEEAFLFLKQEEKHEGGKIFGTDWHRSIDQEVIKISATCPNCGLIGRELLCIPTGKLKAREWFRNYGNEW